MMHFYKDGKMNQHQTLCTNAPASITDEDQNRIDALHLFSTLKFASQ